MKLFDVGALSSLRGNMARCCDHARAGNQKCKPSRAEIIARKNATEKAERSAASFKRIRESLFSQPKFARVAAVVQTGAHNFRVLAGCRIPANAEITRGELNKVLSSRGFDGFRFADTGKRVLEFSLLPTGRAIRA